MKKNLLLLGMLCVFDKGFAQKTVSLKPFVGMQMPLCRFDKQFPHNEDLAVNPLEVGFNYGLWLAFRFNQDWALNSGLSVGHTGWSLTKNMEVGDFSGHFNEEVITHDCYRWQVLAQRRLGTVTALNLDPEKETYLLNFDYYLTAGLSYDVTPRRGSDTDTIILGSSYTYNRTLEKDFALEKFTNLRSGSVFVGIGAQFFHRNNARFDLTLFYSQGLTDVLTAEIDYRQGDTRQKAKVRTRGSLIGVTIAYPIRLKTFDRKPG